MSDKINRKWGQIFLLLLIGALFFVLIQWLDVNITPDTKEIPDGWHIIRPPHDVSALAVQGDIIWAGGKDGVIGLDRSSHQVINEIICDPPITYVRALLVDNEGTVAAIRLLTKSYVTPLLLMYGLYWLTMKELCGLGIRQDLPHMMMVPVPTPVPHRHFPQKTDCLIIE
jgi:ligand-binding sensor domain-containing protein